MKAAKDLKVGDRFRMEEDNEVIIHEVVQVYSKRKFNGSVMIIKTDKGASLELSPDFGIEME